MSTLERKVSKILDEKYHKMWQQECAKKENEITHSTLSKYYKFSVSQCPTYARDIMFRTRRRWHSKLRSLGIRTSYAPVELATNEISLSDPSGHELELADCFMIVPMDLAIKILVLGELL